MGRNQLHLIKNEFFDENGQSEITNFPVSLIVSKGPVRVPKCWSVQFLQIFKH